MIIRNASNAAKQEIRMTFERSCDTLCWKCSFTS